MTSTPPRIESGVSGWAKLIAAMVLSAAGGGFAGGGAYSQLMEYRLQALEAGVRDRTEEAAVTQRDVSRLDARVSVIQERVSQTEMRIMDELSRIRARVESIDRRLRE